MDCLHFLCCYGPGKAILLQYLIFTQYCVNELTSTSCRCRNYSSRWLKYLLIGLVLWTETLYLISFVSYLNSASECLQIFKRVPSDVVFTNPADVGSFSFVPSAPAALGSWTETESRETREFLRNRRLHRRRYRRGRHVCLRSRSRYLSMSFGLSGEYEAIKYHFSLRDASVQSALIN